jgi:hypothetical protein
MRRNSWPRWAGMGGHNGRNTQETPTPTPTMSPGITPTPNATQTAEIWNSEMYTFNGLQVPCNPDDSSMSDFLSVIGDLNFSNIENSIQSLTPTLTITPTQGPSPTPAHP